jgi:NitT/TauT family transport system substrate-binding protein
VPANLAATLYNKTNGAVEVACINTLGVLYIVENGETVNSVGDLKGQTIVTTGKGATPEYVLRYVLTENGVDPDSDVTIEYCSEATEALSKVKAAKPPSPCCLSPSSPAPCPRSRVCALRLT